MLSLKKAKPHGNSTHFSALLLAVFLPARGAHLDPAAPICCR
jgi:hypothetical protein